MHTNKKLIRRAAEHDGAFTAKTKSRIIKSANAVNKRAAGSSSFRFVMAVIVFASHAFRTMRSLEKSFSLPHLLRCSSEHQQTRIEVSRDFGIIEEASHSFT